MTSKKCRCATPERNTSSHVEQTFHSGNSPKSTQFTCFLQPLYCCFILERLINKTYLCNIDKLCDHFCPLQGCWLAENHELDPLGDTVKQSNRSLQSRIVLQAAMDYIALVVCELTRKGKDIFSKMVDNFRVKLKL